MVSNLVKEIERFGLGESLGLAHAFRESLPRHDRFDRLERIVAIFFGLQQGPAQLSVQPHLIVNGLAGAVKLLLMFLFRGIEEPADNAVMQINDLVGDRCCGFHDNGHQGGMTAPRFEPGQIGRGHLRAFARNLEQAIPVHHPVEALGQINGVEDFQAINVFEHLARTRLSRRQPQPGEPCHPAVVTTFQ